MLGGAVSQTKSKLSGSEQREKELGKVGKPRDSSLYQKLVVGKSVERRKGAGGVRLGGSAGRL